MIKSLARAAFLAIAVAVVLAGFSACLPQAEPDTLIYRGPVELSVAVGTTLVGTNVVYVGAPKDGMAEFEIDGVKATKKVGDSLNWSGEPMSGVEVTLALRILLINEEEVHAGGTVTLQVKHTVPQAADINEELPIRFAVPVTYGVDKGEAIPATFITYERRDEELGAMLGGLDEYPYRKVGDSVVWQGQLREDVFLKLDLRVLYYSADNMRVGGIATLWLAP